MKYVLLMYLVLCVLIVSSCESNSQITQNTTQDICINCPCLNEMFSDINALRNSERTYCSIEEETASRIFSWVEGTTNLEKNCSAISEVFINHLQSDFNKNACGVANRNRSDVGNKLITRCNEDQQLTPVVSKRMRDNFLNLDSKINECKMVQAYSNSSVLLVRAENEHFLERNLDIIFSNQKWENDNELLKSIKLIALHADYNENLRENILNQFLPLVRERKIDPNLYIEIFDRKSLFSNTQQVYGWSTKCVDGRAIFFPPLKDKNVANQLRSEIGAISVTKFLANMSDVRCNK